MEEPAFIDQPEDTTELPEANARTDSIALSDTSEIQSLPSQDELVDTSTVPEIIPVLQERVTDTTFIVNRQAFGGMKMGFGRLYDQAKEVGNVAQTEAEATLSYFGQAVPQRYGGTVGEVDPTQNSSPTSNLFSVAKKFVEQAKVEADRTGKQVEEIVYSVFGINQSRDTLAMIDNHLKESEALAEKHADELFNKAKEIVSQNNRIGDEVASVAEVLSGVEAQSLVQSAVQLLDETRRLTDAHENVGSTQEVKEGEVEVGADSESEAEALTEVESEALTEAEAEGLTEVEAEALTEVEAEALTEVEAEALTEVEAVEKVEVEAELESEYAEEQKLETADLPQEDIQEQSEEQKEED